MLRPVKIHSFPIQIAHKMTFLTLLRVMGDYKIGALESAHVDSCCVSFVQQFQYVKQLIESSLLWEHAEFQPMHPHL